MDFKVKILEEENIKIGDTYHKQKKKDGKKFDATLLQIEGDYGYIVRGDTGPIEKIKLTLLEVVDNKLKK